MCEWIFLANLKEISIQYAEAVPQNAITAFVSHPVASANYKTD